MVGHVKLHGHGEDQRERDHAEVSHLNEIFQHYDYMTMRGANTAELTSALSEPAACEPATPYPCRVGVGVL
eukprot:scaffold15026_cov167-Isochrysis_galbana.AAC.1